MINNVLLILFTPRESKLKSFGNPKEEKKNLELIALVMKIPLTTPFLTTFRKAGFTQV